MSDTSWNVNDYPEPPPEIPEPECPRCGWGLSDEVFELDGEYVCAECFKEYLKELGLEYIADELKINHKSKEALYE